MNPKVASMNELVLPKSARRGHLGNHYYEVPSKLFQGWTYRIRESGDITIRKGREEGHFCVTPGGYRFRDDFDGPIDPYHTVGTTIPKEEFAAAYWLILNHDEEQFVREANPIGDVALPLFYVERNRLRQQQFQRHYNGGGYAYGPVAPRGGLWSRIPLISKILLGLAFGMLALDWFVIGLKIAGKIR